MAESENRNLSQETLQQINDGVNFVSDWLFERYTAGKMTEDEYNQAIEKIRNVKILPTSRGTDRLIDAYEQGELKLNGKYTRQGLDVEALKKALLSQSSYAGELRGLSTHWSDNPVILLDVDKIKAESGERSDLSSVVVHELTHCLGLKETSEKEIQNSLYGNFGATREATVINSSDKPHIAVQVIPDNGVNKYVHTNKGLDRVGEKPDGMLLNEGVIYDPYEDKASEIYARIMQMRFDMNLDPAKVYSPDDVEKLRQDLLKRTSATQNGADNDILMRIFERYSNEQISHFLNDTAQMPQANGNEHNYLANIKQIMLDDAGKYVEMLASLENNPDKSLETEQQKQDKSQNSSVNDVTFLLRSRQRDLS